MHGGIILKVPDRDRIYGADKNTGIRELDGNGFIVSIGMFHTRHLICSMRALIEDWGDVAGRQEDYSAGPVDSDSAFPFRNINPTAFIIETPLKRISNSQYQSYSLPIQFAGNFTRT